MIIRYDCKIIRNDCIGPTRMYGGTIWYHYGTMLESDLFGIKSKPNKLGVIIKRNQHT